MNIPEGTEQPTQQEPTTEEVQPRDQKAPEEPTKDEPKEDPKEPEEPKDAKPDKRKAIDGDDVDVDDKGTVNMPFTAFQKRLSRAATQATKNALRDIFGTDDGNKIKALVKQGKEAQAQLDKTKREQMSEMEKLKDDSEKLRVRAEQAEKLLVEYEQSKLMEQGEQKVTSVASKYVASDYVEDAVAVYQRHLSRMSDEEIDALESSDVTDWFKDYVERKPALAKKAPDKKKVTEPVSNGPNPDKKPEKGKGSGITPGKTPRPNQSNSMTRLEWEQYKRDRGLNF